MSMDNLQSLPQQQIRPEELQSDICNTIKQIQVSKDGIRDTLKSEAASPILEALTKAESILSLANVEVERVGKLLGNLESIQHYIYAPLEQKLKDEIGQINKHVKNETRKLGRATTILTVISIIVTLVVSFSIAAWSGFQLNSFQEKSLDIVHRQINDEMAKLEVPGLFNITIAGQQIEADLSQQQLYLDQKEANFPRKIITIDASTQVDSIFLKNISPKPLLHPAISFLFSDSIENIANVTAAIKKNRLQVDEVSYSIPVDGIQQKFIGIGFSDISLFPAMERRYLFPSLKFASSSAFLLIYINDRLLVLELHKIGSGCYDMHHELHKTYLTAHGGKEDSVGTPGTMKFTSMKPCPSEPGQCFNAEMTFFLPGSPPDIEQKVYGKMDGGIFQLHRVEPSEGIKIQAWKGRCVGNQIIGEWFSKANTYDELTPSPNNTWFRIISANDFAPGKAFKVRHWNTTNGSDYSGTLYVKSIKRCASNDMRTCFDAELVFPTAPCPTQPTQVDITVTVSHSKRIFEMKRTKIGCPGIDAQTWHGEFHNKEITGSWWNDNSKPSAADLQKTPFVISL